MSKLLNLELVGDVSDDLPGELVDPFGADLLKGLDAELDLGAVACLVGLSSGGQKIEQGSGQVDDWPVQIVKDFSPELPESLN